SHASIVLSGSAGMMAGALSMAVGEYVSVSAQADSEAAALAQERDELEVDPAGERRELTDIYVNRGLELLLPGRSPSSSWRTTPWPRTRAMSSDSPPDPWRGRCRPR